MESTHENNEMENETEMESQTEEGGHSEEESELEVIYVEAHSEFEGSEGEMSFLQDRSFDFLTLFN